MQSPTPEQARAQIAADADNPAWIHIPKEFAAGTAGPLSGVLFGVKDNIDVAGMPTTAACPSYAYDPAVSAVAVQRLVDAGAVVMGKTNLDQFATGLVGTRSPYGVCHNVFAPDYLSGGSSSGSAVAVARGEVAFALGTDTAGSGRVPAGFNGLVGIKPTPGRVSTRGVLPALSVAAIQPASLAAAFSTSTQRSTTSLGKPGGPYNALQPTMASSCG